RNGHWAQAELGKLAGNLVPDHRRLSVEVVRLTMQRLLAHHGDELGHHLVIDVDGRYLRAACVMGQARGADAMTLGFELCSQHLPGLGQTLSRRLDRLQPACGDGSEEIGADIGKSLLADAARYGIYGVQLVADFGKIERYAVRLLSDQPAEAGDGRIEVP